MRCQLGGEHIAYSARLRLQSARWSDALSSLQLSRDEAAQHWLGWTPDEARRDLALLGHDPLLISSSCLSFVGFDVHTDRIIASITLNRIAADTHDIGAVVEPTARGQGYGREALATVSRIAHQHFGIAALRAGCESTNVVSRRWLESCGFVRVDGPTKHTLPNGRVADALWWHHADPTAKRRCRSPLTA